MFYRLVKKEMIKRCLGFKKIKRNLKKTYLKAGLGSWG